ncbi:MAG TPA: hypothetical protein VNO26_04995 [Candidatus Limnocylindria bacterium]|nr:hypothetical protein [Candidatus Limnocylindria bacterium]
MSTPERGERPLSRNPLVLGGLLLLMVGVADVIAGYRKLEQYRQELRALPPPPPPNPAELFPKASAADERENILHAKISYYGMLTTTGRILVLIGAAAMAVGYVRHRVVQRARSR